MAGRFGSAAAAVALLVAAAMPFPAAAQSERTGRVGETPNLPAWIVTCSNGNPQAVFRCVMQQTLYVATTRQRIIAMTIDRQDDGYRGLLLLPHGIDFTKPVEYWVDDGARQVAPILNADENGSYARIDMSKAMVEAMKAGSVFRVSAMPVAGDDLVIEMSLAGFSASLGLLDR